MKPSKAPKLARRRKRKRAFSSSRSFRWMYQSLFYTSFYLINIYKLKTMTPSLVPLGAIVMAIGYYQDQNSFEVARMNRSGTISAFIAFVLLTNLVLLAPPTGAVTGPRSLSDITVSGIQVSAAPLFKGDNITITATIKNLGTDPATNVSVHFEAWNNTLSVPIDLGNDTTVGHANGGTNLSFNQSVQVSVHWNTSKPGKTVTGGLIYSINVTAKNETDGSSSNNINRTTVQFIDDAYLVVSEAIPSATAVPGGGPFNISYKVQNIGTKSQDVLGDNLQLFIDQGTLPVETHAIQGLTPGHISVGLFFPDTSDLSPGNHSFKLQLQNAGRNATINNITILSPHPHITNLTWFPVGGKVGDAIIVNAAVTNDGTANITGLVVSFYVDAPYVIPAYQSVMTVAKSGQNISSFNWNTTGLDVGNHTVKASLKPDWPSENITSNITLGIGGKADLAVMTVTIMPDTVDIGDTVNITIDIKNIGTWDSTPTNVSITYVQGIESHNLAWLPLNALAPGESAFIYYNWATTGLSFWNLEIMVRVDPENTVNETVLSNNKGSATLTVRAKPDLLISALNMTFLEQKVTSAHKGDIVSINAVLGNIGTRPSDPTTLSFYLDGSTTPLKTMDVLGIVLGGAPVMPYTWDTSNVSIGNHTIRVIIDPLNNNTELNETNNELSLNVTVLPARGFVDLTVLSVSLDPKTPSVGQYVSVQAAIKNLGTAKALNVSVQFAYIVNKTNIAFDTEVVSSVAPGESLNVTIRWATGTLSSGSYVLNVTIDPLNNLQEKDRTNNFKSLPFALAPKSPGPGKVVLHIDALVLSTAKPNADKSVVVSVTVRNSGDRNGTNIKVVLFVDDIEIGTQTIPSLPKNGGTTTVNFTWKPAKGLHEVVARAYIGTSAVPDDTSSKVVRATEGSKAALGSYLPLIILIILLAVIAVALLAMGGKEKKKATVEEVSEEDEVASSEEE
jgi:subtilase family serine protease